MALKNINKKQIQFTQYVTDPDQSIRDLIRPEKKYEKNPNPKKPPATLPPSFYQQKRPRGSSAGHSPQVPSPSHMAHGGSVDEVASSSRTAISPAMGMMPNPPNFHKRQFSAPELHPDCNIERIPPVAPPNHPPPNVNHQYSKSVSALPPMSMGFPLEPQHVKSVSHEAYSYAGYSDAPAHPGMMQQAREKSSSLDPMRRPFMTPQDVEHLPMPHGWEMCYDSEGHRYYKDHNSKTTTWNDPRLIPREQAFGMDDMGQGYNNFYDNGHSSRSLPSIHQQQQMIPNHPQPQYSSQQQMDYIQQLQNERMMIQEKNAQLMNSGLLDSPQPQFQAISPMGSNMMQPHEQNYMYQQQAHTSQQQQPQHNINQMPNQYQNSQMNDTAMEVDYSIPPHPQQHQQHQHQPQMHRDMQNNYEINDINPHEFDQYLQISNNETNRGVGSMVHHYQ
ncbi:hypothetical protein GCK72_023622 [Caenorhabditis remanei]|nr:hypothetical protein GCK72_023622 [Caenorhabditis remanei]KAF1747161.1 hypothetical protein GCK72_023622 [Caenorhabditis remanei]